MGIYVYNLNKNRMFNTFGNIFRITSFGESHGAGVGLVIDGCPSGIKLDLQAIQNELDRRKPGQNRISSQRKESDTFHLLSGHLNGETTGAPLTFFVPNEDARSKDYAEVAEKFRPSHADFTYYKKYGIHDYRGGGRSSARETITRVIGGAVAKQVLQKYTTINVGAWVSAIEDIEYNEMPKTLTFPTEYCQMLNCPAPEIAEKMFHHIDEVRKAGDSVGGIITCAIQNVPVGLGEPIFGKLHAALGAAMLSINAVKGFEYGSGFTGTKMRGSTHNDIFFANEKKEIHTQTNFSGGIQGGISNGEEIYFRVAFKPTATIMQAQETVDKEGNSTILLPKGRHDPCVVPRAVPIVEGMAALVLVDFWLYHQYNYLGSHR